MDNLIISAIKRVFSRSQYAKDFKNKCVVKGKYGKKGGKIGRCECCNKEFPLYKLSIDHVDAIVPVMLSGRCMAFSMLYERTFCDVSNLQILCLECHKEKSKKEMSERSKWRKKEKFVLIRHKSGTSMLVFPITNLKELDENYEVLAVSDNIKDMTQELKRRLRL